LVYDYATNTLDTISAFRYDTTIKGDHTDHFCGAKKIQKLDQNVPTSNLIDDTKFTNLIPLANIERELAFPYTTGVKIVLPNNGDKHQASGVMVGEKFVLTTGHSTLKKYTNERLFDKLDVIAAYDHVLSSDEELRSSVNKIYFVKDWGIGDGEDIVLLELDEPIGAKSGWMSIGFEEEGDKLKDHLYHKMSYPAYNTPYNDKPYSGDDLHISYGIADYVSPEFLGVQNHIMGLGGESGSPIFTTNNEDEFITYGVLTYLGNYNHTRLRPSIYYAFERILNGTQPTIPAQSDVLKNFEVSNITGNRVMVGWDLTDNTMYKGYEISRSYDGENYDHLKTMDAEDINRNNAYGYIDKKPLNGMVYYKLVGIDGEENKQFLGAKLVKVGRESKYDINIYPNPATEFVTIEARKEMQDDVKLMIFNAQGKIMGEQTLSANSKTIATHDYARGVYHILLIDQDDKESFSFVVQ